MFFPCPLSTVVPFRLARPLHSPKPLVALVFLTLSPVWKDFLKWSNTLALWKTISTDRVGIGPWGSLFWRTQSWLCPELSNAPWLVFRGAVEAKKVSVAAACLLWGCPGMNFKAKLPFYGIEEGLCGLQKRDPHSPSCIVFKDLK